MISDFTSVCPTKHMFLCHSSTFHHVSDFRGFIHMVSQQGLSCKAEYLVNSQTHTVLYHIRLFCYKILFSSFSALMFFCTFNFSLMVKFWLQHCEKMISSQTEVLKLSLGKGVFLDSPIRLECNYQHGMEMEIIHYKIR